MTTTETKRQQTARVAREYMEAMARQDLQAAGALWEPGGVDDLVGIAKLTAPEGVAEFFGELFRAVPRFDFSVESLVADEEMAVVHWRMRGVFDGTGKTMGLAPNGRAMDMLGADRLVIRDGKIVANTAIINGLEMARQLAILPAQDSRLEKLMYGLVNLTAPAAKAIRVRRAAR